MSEEHFDILDTKGKPIGKSKPRSKVHRDGDWHACVHVWFINYEKKEVLVQQRVKTKDSWPGYYDVSVAGHLSAGDDPLSAAIREVQEELGITLDPKQLHYSGTITQTHVLKDGKFIDNEFAHLYAVKSSLPVNAFTLQETEVEKVEWIPMSKLFDIQLHDPKSQGFVPLQPFKLYRALVFPEFCPDYESDDETEAQKLKEK